MAVGGGSQGSFKLRGLVCDGGREREAADEGTGWHLRRRADGQRAEGLQQTVLVGSASSVSALLAMSWSSSALTSSCRTASTMGITMAVVDVLESHMESRVVQLMKQSSSLESREGRAERQLHGNPQPPVSQGSWGASDRPEGVGLENHGRNLSKTLGFYAFHWLCTPRA